MTIETTFERVLGYGSEAGTVLYTVPTGATVTVIGYVFNNVTTEDRTINFKVSNTELPNGIELIPADLPLPSGSGFAPAEVGKIVLKAGDQLVVQCDEDYGVSAVVSFMLQQETN